MSTSSNSSKDRRSGAKDASTSPVDDAPVPSESPAWLTARGEPHVAAPVKMPSIPRQPPGDALKRLREKRHLTQRQLAEQMVRLHAKNSRTDLGDDWESKVHAQRVNIARWENGAGLSSFDKAKLAFEALGIQNEWLAIFDKSPELLEAILRAGGEDEPLMPEDTSADIIKAIIQGIEDNETQKLHEQLANAYRLLDDHCLLLENKLNEKRREGLSLLILVLQLGAGRAGVNIKTRNRVIGYVKEFEDEFLKPVIATQNGLK